MLTINDINFNVRLHTLETQFSIECQQEYRQNMLKRLIYDYCPNRDICALISVNSNNMTRIAETTPQWIITDDH